MRIWLVKTGEEMPDDGPASRLVRMAILAEELASRGHEVIFWNACFNHHKKTMRYDATTEMRSQAGYDVVFLKGRSYQKNISAARFIHQFEVAREFTREAPKHQKPDVILSALPTIELSREVSLYARQNNVPLAIDCRDMWPEVITEQLRGPLKLPACLIASYYRRLRYQALSNATSIIGVTQVFLEWALAAAKRQRGEKDRVFHLAISPGQGFDKDMTAQAEAYWADLLGPPNNHETLACFGGTLSRRLDLETLLSACHLIAGKPEAKDLKIVLCGKGDLNAEFEACARDVPQVTFAGWRNAAELDVLMKRSHVGLLPYPPAFDFSNHFVNKIGEYLGQGLPILTGLDGLTHDLLDPAGLKIPYEVGNPQSLAEALLALPTQKAALKEKADTARTIFREQFDPAAIYPAFADHLESLTHG
jgi:glycosyltransferase involved in cell wall biosynthesis